MMHAQSRTIFRSGLLLLGVALLVAGCDNGGDPPPDPDAWAMGSFDGRITNYEGGSTSGAMARSGQQASRFRIKSRVAPPDVDGDGTLERATGLSVSPSTDRLYVGYKVEGESFGSGLDIIDVGGAFAEGVDALRTDSFDVEGLAVRDDDRALFLGTARPGAYGATARLHNLKLGPDGTPPSDDAAGIEYDETELPGGLVKSVVAAPNSSTYDAFAVSNVNSVHGIETNGTGWEIDNVAAEARGSASGLRFQSVTETSSGTAYALSDGGHIYEFSSGLPQITESSLGTPSNPRLSAHSVDVDGDGTADREFLFVALNEKGVRVVAPGTGEVVFKDTDVQAMSVTATANLVYAATGDGLSVYGVEGGLGNTNPANGLDGPVRTPIRDFAIQGSGVPSPTNAQVNHVAYDGNYLYIAKGTDGVYKVEPQDPAASAQWASVGAPDGRITNYEGSSASGMATAAAPQAPSFEIKSRVAPPDVDGDGTSERASHLSLSSATNRLYVGYKIVGDPYGGGVDILNVGGALADGSDALQTDDLDVQELAVRDDNEALFVGAALAPDNLGPPSQLHSINLNPNSGNPVSPNDIEYDEAQLPGELAKSVVTGFSSGTYDAFAASNVNSLHGIETTGSGWEIDAVTTETRGSSSSLQFRSVAETSAGTAYALSDGGHLYEFSSGLPQVTSSSLGALNSDASIARLSAHSVDVTGDGNADSEFLFVSLNENGFRVVDPSTGEVRFSDPNLYTTSVTATADTVYVATGDGLSVYAVESGLSNTDSADGLNDLVRTSVSDFSIQGGSVPTPTEAQVNHVVHDGSYLYIAKSTDGVYKVEQN